MINLLPTEQKRQIRAARVNVIVSRYILILGITFLFLMMVLGASQVILSTVKQSADNLLSTNSTTVQQNTGTATRLQEFQTSLANAQTVLNNEINYPRALTNLAALVPANVVLSGVTLGPTSFTQPTTLIAFAKTNADATTFQNNLQSSPFFSNVTIQSITNTSGDSSYPVSATFNVTMNVGIAK